MEGNNELCGVRSWFLRMRFFGLVRGLEFFIPERTTLCVDDMVRENAARVHWVLEVLVYIMGVVTFIMKIINTSFGCANPITPFCLIWCCDARWPVLRWICEDCERASTCSSFFERVKISRLAPVE
jgi:hypothetical protein